MAVNDITDSKTLAYLLKYDSILGNLPNTVTHTEDSISVDGKSFKVFKVKDPAQTRLDVGGRADRGGVDGTVYVRAGGAQAHHAGR